METITNFLMKLSWEKILPAAISLAVCIVAAGVVNNLLKKMVQRSKLDSGLKTFFASVLRVAIYAIAIVIAAGTLGFNVSSLVALLSVVSLALSLAIQGALSNVAGGIQILLTKPLRVGDYVQVNGNEGTVQELRLLYTVIDTVDNRRIFIPNSDVIATSLVNYSVNGKRRLDLTFSVAYGSDIDNVRQTLLRCAEDLPVLPDPAPVVYLVDYKDSAIDYTLRVWCSVEDYWTVNFAIRENAQREFEKSGIEMTYPHINVHMLTDR